MKDGAISFKFELKELKEDGSFQGYANVFDVVDYGGDVVAKGAFKDTLAEAKRTGIAPKMLWQHRSDQPIGVWSSMKEDSVGLAVEGQLVLDVQQAQEAYALLKAGALDAMSIGYRPKEWKYDNTTDIRTLTKVDLLEVSLVTFPMNNASRVSSVKGMQKYTTVREFEDFLRDAGGFSAAEAKTIASRGYKAPRDERAGIKDALRRNSTLLRGA